MTFHFNDLKATQAAALLLKENDGEMDTYLFIKMLYLADRESMKRWAEPITGDTGKSMKYGPVDSMVYDLSKGKEVLPMWNKHVSTTDTDTNMLELLEDPGFSELAPAEIEILKDVWTQFHKFTFWQMKNYSHSLPEYNKRVIELNTSETIEPETILKALKFSEDQIREIEAENKELEKLHNLFGAY